MALREIVGKWIIMSAISLVTFGIGPLVMLFMHLWTKNRQELWAKLRTRSFVNDPQGAMRAAASATMISPPPQVPAPVRHAPMAPPSP